jgi:hypothetical protein
MVRVRLTWALSRPGNKNMNEPKSEAINDTRQPGLAPATCYAATVIAHTPSGPVPACEEHACRIRDLMRFMGAHVNFTQASPGDECSNCINEAKRHNDQS